MQAAAVCPFVALGSRAAIHGRCSLSTPALPIRGREKGGKGRETYKLEIKTALLLIREIMQNIQNQY